MYVTAEEEIGYTCLWLRAWDQGRHVEFAGKSECWIGDEATVAMNREKYDRRY